MWYFSLEKEKKHYILCIRKDAKSQLKVVNIVIIQAVTIMGYCKFFHWIFLEKQRYLYQLPRHGQDDIIWAKMWRKDKKRWDYEDY